MLMIRWTFEREREREKKKKQHSLANERTGENLTFERKHGSFVECSLLEMN